MVDGQRLPCPGSGAPTKATRFPYDPAPASISWCVLPISQNRNTVARVVLFLPQILAWIRGTHVRDEFADSSAEV